jgi:hypothetical protein
MPIMSGWEVSSDRVEKYEKMMSQDAIGDPIITSKCKLNKDLGFLVASNNGFAWRIQAGMRTSMYSMGKSKWIRWHDVDRIDLKKEGVILVYIKVRDKDGTLKIDGKGNPKLKKWQFVANQNKNEDKGHFAQRRAAFFSIMSDIFNQNKGDVDPPTSDSRM